MGVGIGMEAFNFNNRFRFVLTGVNMEIIEVPCNNIRFQHQVTTFKDMHFYHFEKL